MLLYKTGCHQQNKSSFDFSEILDVFGIQFMPISCSHIFFWISHGFSPLGYNQVKTTMLQGYVYAIFLKLSKIDYCVFYKNR